MRGNNTEAVDALLAHGGEGVLNTDWGDNGHLQYLPISEPGLAYGAAVAWCAATNRDLDLAAALSAHCYDDPTGELGATLVALGEVYRELTPQMINVSTLTLPLYWPQMIVGRWPLKGARTEEYEAAEGTLADAAAALGRARPRRDDGALVLDELANATALVSVRGARRPAAHTRRRVTRLGAGGRPRCDAQPRSSRSSPSTSGCGSPATVRVGCRTRSRGCTTCAVATRPATSTSPGTASTPSPQLVSGRVDVPLAGSKTRTETKAGQG